MTKWMNINGREFEAIKPRKREVEPFKPTCWDYRDIYKAYEKPSTSKVFIWDGWKEWASNWQEYEITDMYISSRNCFSFAITANVWNHATYEFIGVLHITKDHDRIYLA